MGRVCVSSLLTPHYSHVHTNDFLWRKSISWGEFLNYALCVEEIMDILKRLLITHLQHLLDAPLLFKIQADNTVLVKKPRWPDQTAASYFPLLPSSTRNDGGKKNKQAPLLSSPGALSCPTVHDLRWTQGRWSPGARIWGFRYRFLAEVEKGFGKVGSEREKTEGPHAGTCPGFLCDFGFVVLDKHEQAEISSQVNNPICWKQPSLSMAAGHWCGGKSSYSMMGGTSKIPRSCAHVSAKGRTWHSVCGGLFRPARLTLSSPAAVVCRPYYNM